MKKLKFWTFLDGFYGKHVVLGTLHIILQPYFTRNFLIMVRGMHFITTDHSSSLTSSLHISFFLLLVPLVLTRFLIPEKLLCIVWIVEKLEENISFMLSRKWGKWLCYWGKKFASKHLMTLVHYSICTQMHHRLLIPLAYLSLQAKWRLFNVGVPISLFIRDTMLLTNDLLFTVFWSGNAASPRLGAKAGKVLNLWKVSST